MKASEPADPPAHDPETLGESADEALDRLQQEVAALRESNRALLERQEVYERALAMAGEALWDWNLIEGRLDSSRYRSRMFGYEPGELPEDLDTWLHRMHPEDLPKAQDAAQRYWRGEAPRYEVEYRQRHRDGHWVWVLSRGEAVSRDARGRVTRMLGTAVDISARKALEEQVAALHREREASLTEALQRSEDMAHAKAQFLATMAHEIRTPLNSVVGGTALALMETDPERQRESLQLIDTAARHLLQLVNHVLDFSRIEAGEVSLESALLSIRHLVQTVGTQFAGALHAKALQWRPHVDPALPARLLGDGTRLLQVLTNLVSNAIKFTEHGHIALEARLVALEPAAARVRITVRDTGIGMDEAQQARLFKPFVQADDTIARRFGGTGLGLVISRRIAELMGGTLLMDSAPGQGTTFTLEWLAPLPESAAASAPAPEAEAAPAPGGGLAERLAEAAAGLVGWRVLVVDDNRMNRLVVRRLLERVGLRVEESASGPEALQRLRTDTFDAVLMDLYMPEMSGADCTRAIRGELGLNGLPVIALSASVTQDERALCRASGMDDFVPKPVDPMVLLQALHQRRVQPRAPSPSLVAAPLKSPDTAASEPCASAASESAPGGYSTSCPRP